MIARSLLVAGFILSSGMALALVALSQSDEQAVRNVEQANLAEVQMGKIAQQNASATVVKNLGKRMADDHAMLEINVKNWAKDHAVTLPTEVAAQDQTEIDKFKALTGKDFDKQFTQLMLVDHKNDIAALTAKVENTANPDLKSMLKGVLPILENHLRAAEYVAGQIGISGKDGFNKPVHP